MNPRYPIYVPSKGRASAATRKMTGALFVRDKVPFTLVVEPQEKAEYEAAFPTVPLLVLPKDNGGLPFARNFIWDHARSIGAERHWQIDDNIRNWRTLYKGKRVQTHSGFGLRVCEDLTDMYEDIGLSGLSYNMFNPGRMKEPFSVNVHVYSCTLHWTQLPFRYRGFANEDVDMCLQVLASGYCTIQLRSFLAEKMATMKMKGGNTTDLYQYEDSRLKITRHLVKKWPHIVKLDRRFGRPHHVINWSLFKKLPTKKPGAKMPRHEMRLQILREVQEGKTLHFDPANL